ncbi:MerR family transcriptional regulator [Enterococcus alcedinis]|uniref:MerR family transcriptional regulator n=1 Tax=Enterococcus alcedinis TaxID=1274384 RepID=A0A917N3Y7_9ENTE|nr:XRE family transcriptional regulator [Enterococcus alcedinis]MBP2101412.1 transcriptional regulator with XRE-family HTH domain [Enterococcus alcedinis]GGI65195.1 MerR family transcriptional regulator [Enterococcus alcedinis]
MESIDIGKKIEKYRKEKEYSMRELSRITGITPSMLSQIERGLANPSIQTLKTLSKALNVPIFYFFLEENRTENLIVRHNERRNISVGDITYELLSPDLSGELETIIMTVPSNTLSSDSPIGHKGEEIAYVMEGKIVLYLEETKYILEVGDTVKIPPFMNHKWENNTDQAVKIIFSVTPAVF